MNKIAFLDYTFIFEPSSTWQHLYQFEKDLSDFFAAHGMEAQIVDTVAGHSGRQILYISKIEEMVSTATDSSKNPVGRPQTLKGRIKELTEKPMRPQERDFKKGTFLKSKGYIKR